MAGTIGSSMRLYHETLSDPGQWGRVEVPTVMLMTPQDMFPTRRAWAERSYDDRRWTDTGVGGHFLECEEPAIVAADMFAWHRERLR